MSRILPSKIRKKFNRTEFSGSRLNLLDLVMTPEGTIGQYYGISIPIPRSQSNTTLITYEIPSKLVVLLYKIDDIDNKESRTLPEYFDYNEKLIPITYLMTSRKITPKDDTDIVPVKISQESIKPVNVPSWRW